MTLVQLSRHTIFGIALTGSAFFAIYWIVRKKMTKRKAIHGEKTVARLVSKTNIAKNVVELAFALPEDLCLSIQACQHVKAYAQFFGKNIARSYTPTLSNDLDGTFSLCVKMYPKTEDSETRGAMSRHLFNLEPGHEIEICGLFGRNLYNKLSSWTIKKGIRELKYQNVSVLNLIAGGSGLTPMIQIINSVLGDPDDSTEIRLLVANSTLHDVFFKDRLDEYEQDARGQVHIWYTISEKADGHWPYSTGRVNSLMFAEYLRLTENSLSFICGPSGFEKTAIECLTELEYDADRIVKL